MPNEPATAAAGGSVLNSPVPVEASLRIVRAFVCIREQLLVNRELAKKFPELEKRMDAQDESTATLFEAIRHLLEPPAASEPKRETGFHMRETAQPCRVLVHPRK